MKAPYMPVFTDALLADTLHLSPEEFGVYCLLLFATWTSNGEPLPDDDKILARIARISTRKWRSVLRPKCAPFFDISDGFWRQKRLEKEWAHVQQTLRKNRENGKKGGRPRAETENPTVNPNRTQTLTQTKAPIPIPIPKEESKNHPPPPYRAQPPACAREAPPGRSPAGERDDGEDSNSVREEEFERFWNAYPRRANRRRALAAFVDARKTASLDELMAGAERYASERDGKEIQFTARPENWLADQRWLDDPADATVAAAPIPFDPIGSPGYWRRRMRMWMDPETGRLEMSWPRGEEVEGDTRTFAVDWGPAPGEPGCKVPPEVLAEFGFYPVAA